MTQNQTNPSPTAGSLSPQHIDQLGQPLLPAVGYSDVRQYVANVEKSALVYLIALLCSDKPEDVEFAKQQIREFVRLFSY